MLKTGVYQNLTVVSRKEHGVYLAENADAGKTERVLLPSKEVPEDTQIGEPLRVFIYRDSMDRLIATTTAPLITLGEVRLLKVKEVTAIGAFLDWGLPKDLLLPFAEMVSAADGKKLRLHPGDEILAALYLDKSGRLAATMKIYPYLRTDSPYIKDMHVSARIYQIEESFGAFAAVDDLYSGLIPRREMTGRERLGEVMTLRVTGVREDGKLDLSSREAAYKMMEEDSENVLSVIRDEYSGVLPFDDKASPEKIREVFGLSKAAFKRAVGKLYKERQIRLEEGQIFISDED